MKSARTVNDEASAPGTGAATVAPLTPRAPHRTNAEKREAVLKVLGDPEWSKLSDREIARRCRVDHKTVAKCRREREQKPKPDAPAPAAAPVEPATPAKRSAASASRRAAPPPAAQRTGQHGGALALVGPALMMNSREIADLVSKEHFHVLRDIRALLEDLGEDASKFGCVLTDAYDRPLKALALPKDLTFTLMAGYSAPMRHRIVTRWMELEAQAVPSLPNFADPAAAARAWADAHEARGALAIENAKQAEQIADLRLVEQAHERIAVADGSSCISDCAKVLQMRPKDLFGWMHSNGWIFKRTAGGRWVARQERIDQVLLEHKLVPIEHADGRETVHEQVRVTRKGLARLAELMQSESCESAFQEGLLL